MIAWFIMLHNKPAQFEWLLNAIYDPDDVFLVHVDLKSLLNYKGRGGTYSRVREIIGGRANIRLMRPRATNWGGWSLGRISLDAIDLLLAADDRWTHFVNLSGECYPIKPMAAIRDVLRSRPHDVYIQTKAFEDLPPGDWHPRRPRVFETPLRIVVLPGKRKAPQTFRLDHKGSQWVILPLVFFDWQRQAPFRRDMDAYMRFSALSDELVMQALLLNGPYRERQAADYGRAIKLIEPAAHPEVLTIEDLDYVHASPALFARKFDASRDESILFTLAEEIGAAPPALAN